MCLCVHDFVVDDDDDKNKLQPDDAFLERSLDALDAFDRRLMTSSKSTTEGSQDSSQLSMSPELSSFVATANAKTGLNVKSIFQRLAKRALERRERLSV